ncbi:MAG TPA: RIP metalloprotease RseP [Bacteroidia bacterium]|nr:RIP metalloprotease RseP [Bacteroidia bacterium]
MVKFTLFFFSLSLLIILHEFGHFITARWFKARVDKFYLFFDFLFPFPGIAKFALFKKKIGETEYGIGWFPFGGYVDIAGMTADSEEDKNKKDKDAKEGEEGKDAPEEKKEPKPPGKHEFRGKKPYQRLIILAGGITVNALLAIVIYSMVSWAYGEAYLPVKNAKYGMAVDSVAMGIGLKDGDKLLSVDNKPMESFQDAKVAIILDKAKTIQVDRNGEKVNISVPDGFDQTVVEKDVKVLFDARFPFVVDSIIPGMPAAKSGMMKGDSIVSIDGDTLVYFQQIARKLSGYANKTAHVGIVRNGSWKTIDIAINGEGKMGVLPYAEDRYMTLNTKEYGFFSAWGRGFQRTGEVLVNYVKQLRLLFTKAGAKKIGGFATIGGLFPSTWDWEAFWNITAFLSVILAFMNLLPIPVLDGGYILFVLWEMITGKKVSDKFMQKALTIGMYIVLGLLIFANGNDILRAFRH